MLPESLPSLLSGFLTAFITILGYGGAANSMGFPLLLPRGGPPVHPVHQMGARRLEHLHQKDDDDQTA